MTCSPDWRKTLRRASCDGVSFHVETEKESGKRRIKYHEFPHVDTLYAEDLGEGVRKFQVTAYVHGQDAVAQSNALIAILSSKGAKRLVLPAFYTGSVTCPEWTRVREKDKMGYIAFDIVFVRDAGLSPASFVTGELGRLVEVGFGGLLVPVKAAFDQVYQGVRVADFVVKSSAGLIENLATEFEVVRSSFSFSSVGAALLEVQIADLYSEASALARSGQVGDVFSSSSFRAGPERVSSELPVKIFEIIDGMLEAAPDIECWQMFEGLAGFHSPASLKETTLSRRTEKNNHDSIALVVRTFALGAIAVASTRIDFKTRAQAITVRADISELMGFEIDNYDMETMVVMESIVGQAVEYLSQEIAISAPVLIISQNRMMPAVYWANRIYGDVDRELDLVDRNSVKHPLFLPLEFEALSA